MAKPCCFNGLDGKTFDLAIPFQVHLRWRAMIQQPAPSATSPLPCVLPEDAAERLREIVKSGESVRQNCPATMPVIAPGTFAWAERISRGRQWLLPLGWQQKRDNNFELCVSPCGRYAITSRGGDAATGKHEQTPRLARAGKLTQAATLQNGQLLMFEAWERENLPRRPVERNTAPGRKTYILLVYRDLSNKEIRCELSLPVALDEDGQVVDWEDRHILDPIPIEDASSSSGSSGGSHGGGEEEPVDFDVDLLGSAEALEEFDAGAADTAAEN